MPRKDELPAEIRRVLVVGGPGSGKTTLARTLAAALGVPHHDLDRVAYAPPGDRFDAPFRQWVRVPADQRRKRAAFLAEADGWVADGLYADWTAPLRDTADVILWLDLPARVTTWRVLRRAIGHRLRGGNDRDVRSACRVARSALGYRRRPEATADQLQARDGANSNRTLEVFLQPASDRVHRRRSPAAVRLAVREITHRTQPDPHSTSS